MPSQSEGLLRSNTFDIYYFRCFLNFNRIIFRLSGHITLAMQKWKYNIFDGKVQIF